MTLILAQQLTLAVFWSGVFDSPPARPGPHNTHSHINLVPDLNHDIKAHTRHTNCLILNFPFTLTSIEWTGINKSRQYQWSFQTVRKQVYVSNTHYVELVHVTVLLMIEDHIFISYFMYFVICWHTVIMVKSGFLVASVSPQYQCFSKLRPHFPWRPLLAVVDVFKSSDVWLYWTSWTCRVLFFHWSFN